MGDSRRYHEMRWNVDFCVPYHPPGGAFIEGSLASGASQPTCRDTGHEEQTADAGKDGGGEVQAVARDRRTEGQSEQAGGEDGSHVAEGLELATRRAHVCGRGMHVGSRLHAEVVEATGD